MWDSKRIPARARKVIPEPAPKLARLLDTFLQATVKSTGV
jgi:hypothetical protein